MNKMVEYLKKNWLKLTFLILVFVFGIPLLINHAYNYVCPCPLFRMNWDNGSGVILTFYGGILSSAVAIIGVYKTIEMSIAQHNETLRNEARPILVIDVKNNKASVYPSEFQVPQDEEIEGPYYIVSKSGIEPKTCLTRVQDFTEAASSKKNLLIIQIRNVGRNSAMNLRYGVCSTEEALDSWKYTHAVTLPDREVKKTYIYFEDFCNASEGKGYIFYVRYEDIYGNKYQNKKRFIFEKNGKTGKLDLVGDTYDEQEYLGGPS